MMPEALIFDIDGTLWDSRALVAEGYNLQLLEEGLPHLQVTAAQLTPLFGKTDTELGDTLFQDIPLPERTHLLHRCMAREQQHLAQDPCAIGYPGIVPVLEALKTRYRLFIVSNCMKGYPELCTEKLGISSIIEGHLCHGDTGTAKGQTIRTLMARYQISSAVYIGDTQSDCLASQEAGIPFIWASYGFGHPERYDARLDQPEDLLPIFMETKRARRCHY